MNPHYNWILEGISFHNLELFHLRTLRTCFYIGENSHSNHQWNPIQKEGKNSGQSVKKIPDEEGNIKFSDLDLTKKEEKVCFSQS